MYQANQQTIHSGTYRNLAGGHTERGPEGRLFASLQVFSHLMWEGGAFCEAKRGERITPFALPSLRIRSAETHGKYLGYFYVGDVEESGTREPFHIVKWSPNPLCERFFPSRGVQLLEKPLGRPCGKGS